MQGRRVVIVTGASGGIGAATARLFAARGWSVVIAARSAEKLAQVVEAIRAGGGEALAVPTDVTDPGAVRALVAQAVAAYGRVDVLVNNAGRGISGTVEALDLDELEYVFRLNVLAPVAGLQAVVPVMRARGGGVIINVSSLVENIPAPYVGGYAASKIALSYLSDSAAIELADAGIAVVTVLPGVTETAFYDNVSGEGQGHTPLDLIGKVNLLPVASPEAVALRIWQAAVTHRRHTYVTPGDRVLGWLLRHNPELTAALLKLAVPRYAPVGGSPARATVRGDLIRLAGLVGGVLSLLAALGGIGALLWARLRRRPLAGPSAVL